MHSCGRVNKLERVVHRVVSGNIGETLHSAVCSPLIGMDDCAWSNMLLNNWQQRSRIWLRNNLHVPQCRGVRDIYHPKHPDICPWWTTMVIQQSKFNSSVDDLYFKSITFTLWRKRDSSIWTTMPLPPSTIGVCSNLVLHTSLNHL